MGKIIMVISSLLKGVVEASIVVFISIIVGLVCVFVISSGNILLQIIFVLYILLNTINRLLGDDESEDKYSRIIKAYTY